MAPAIPDRHTAQRQWDLVVVGSSGFVGKLAVQHLLHRYGHHPKDFKWAMHGRVKHHLDQAVKEIGGDVDQVEQIRKDCDDDKDVDELVASAHVIAACLSPYSEHGRKLIKACVQKNTHYVDITGEMLWIRENIDLYHDEAEKKHLRIVHACGLGSVPADLSVYLTLQQLKRDGIVPYEVKFLMGPVYSSIGGGTMTSYANAVATAKRTGRIMEMLSSTLLARDRVSPIEVRPKIFLIGYDSDVHRWTAPLWLAALDDEIVCRSASLLDYPQGMQYIEAQTYSGYLFGFISACATAFAAYLFALLLYIGPTRWLLTIVRPPGSGPNRYIREEGYGTAFIVAKGKTKEGEHKTYQGTFEMPKGDPGYNQTAKMMIESALCIALEENKLPKRYGVLTPAAAFGHVLIERLEKNTMMHFTLHPPAHPTKPTFGSQKKEL